MKTDIKSEMRYDINDYKLQYYLRLYHPDSTSWSTWHECTFSLWLLIKNTHTTQLRRHLCEISYNLCDYFPFFPFHISSNYIYLTKIISQRHMFLLTGATGNAELGNTWLDMMLSNQMYKPHVSYMINSVVFCW